MKSNSNTKYRYKIKDEEAKALADFLVSMLEWYPEKRATAQQMLENPWLNMPANYNTHMNEEEYSVHLGKSKAKKEQGPSRDESNTGMSELEESEEDKNNADNEDNSDDENAYVTEEEESVHGEDAVPQIEKKLVKTDKGANPQFSGLTHRA